jgi:hypothetical protein
MLASAARINEQKQERTKTKKKKKARRRPVAGEKTGRR